MQGASGSRPEPPLRFRHGDERWAVSTERLGLAVAVEDAVARALQAESGDDVDVRVDVDREQVRRYVDVLQERFGFPAEDARIVKLAEGRPEIADSKWSARQFRTRVIGSGSRRRRASTPSPRPGAWVGLPGRRCTLSQSADPTSSSGTRTGGGRAEEFDGPPSRVPRSVGAGRRTSR
jgi:hypothetical protein